MLNVSSLTLLSLLAIVCANIASCSEIKVFPDKPKNGSMQDFWAAPYEMFHVTCVQYSAHIGSWKWSFHCLHNNYPFLEDEEKKFWFDSPAPTLVCRNNSNCLYNHSSNFVFQYYGGSDLCNVTCSYAWSNLTIEHQTMTFFLIKPPEDIGTIEMRKCYQAVRWESPSVATIIFFIVLSLCLLHYYTLPIIDLHRPREHVTSHDKKRIMKAIFGEIGDSCLPEPTKDMSSMWRKYTVSAPGSPA